MTSFEVEDIGFFSSQRNLRGMTFAFADEVEVTTTELQIGAKTLLTRVGGVIGVGKEFLWIILCGFTIYCMSPIINMFLLINISITMIYHNCHISYTYIFYPLYGL